MKTSLMQGIAGAVLSLLVLTGVAAGAGGGGSVAVVNAMVISRAEYDRHWPAFSRQKGASPDSLEDRADLRRALMKSLIEQLLLYQEAERMGYRAGDPSVEREFARVCRPFSSQAQIDEVLGRSSFTPAEYREYLRRRLSVENFIRRELTEDIVVTEEEIDSAYAAGGDAYGVPERVHARHILIRVPLEAGESRRESARRKCETLLAALRGGEDFKELARKHSDCSSGARGGDLGFITRGSREPSFEQAVFALAPGDVSGIVETSHGFHIVKSENTLAGGTIPRAAVEEELREAIRSRKISEALGERLNTLRRTASVTITMAF